MSDPMLAEYVICRLGKGDNILGDPVTLSAEAACRRDPARFAVLVREVNAAWKAYYQEEMAKKAQMPLALGD